MLFSDSCHDVVAISYYTSGSAINKNSFVGGEFRVLFLDLGRRLGEVKDAWKLSRDFVFQRNFSG